MDKLKTFFFYNKTKIILVAASVALLVFVLFSTHLICLHEWEEATCTSPVTCSKCNRTKGKALGHNYETATCTEPETCKRCGDTRGEPLGHDANKATCTKASICRRCGETVKEALGHNVKQWTTISNATCTEDGQKEGKCTRCSKTIRKSIKKLGHNWSAYKRVRKATLSHGGKKRATCKRCGKVKNKSIPALDIEEVREDLEEKFPVYEAQSQMEQYGEYEYPYGFKMHTILGVIAEEPKSNSSWFLKYEVTIKNMFGGKYKTVAEAEVHKDKGVTYFYVYN